VQEPLARRRGQRSQNAYFEGKRTWGAFLLGWEKTLPRRKARPIVGGGVRSPTIKKERNHRTHENQRPSARGKNPMTRDGNFAINFPRRWAASIMWWGGGGKERLSSYGGGGTASERWRSFGGENSRQMEKGVFLRNRGQEEVVIGRPGKESPRQL